MSITSAFFLLFAVAAAAAIRVLARFGRVYIFALVAVSLLFYATYNPFYCLPLLATAMTDYLVGRGLGRVKGAVGRRLLLLVSLGVDLGLLCFFKYFNFVTGGVLDLMRAEGWGDYSLIFKIVPMIGISFYTFQSLSYVIDVYRGDQEPETSFAKYLAFVSFFPTVLAGPITRASTLLPQLSLGPAPISQEEGGRALFLITLGFVKKVVLADTIAINLVDRVFELPGMYSSAEILAGVYGYAVQIYCDFSGYSDIAIGAALLLGFRLKDNFSSPYRSADLTEFWRRWHISFSTWLRDYLFFSLPGKRPGTPMPYINLVVTFALGGLWHGASWTYAVWGVMHGAGLAFLRFVQSFGRGRPRKQHGAFRKVLGVFITLNFVTLTWVFFRCSDLAGAAAILDGLRPMTVGTGNVPGIVWAAMLAGLICQWLPERLYTKAQERFVALPALGQAASIVCAGAAVWWAGSSQVASFIYFKY